MDVHQAREHDRTAKVKDMIPGEFAEKGISLAEDVDTVAPDPEGITRRDASSKPGHN
jgi:hypothetical protein